MESERLTEGWGALEGGGGGGGGGGLKMVDEDLVSVFMFVFTSFLL